MKKIEIDKNGFRYKWRVTGVDEDGCVSDIHANERTELTDYVDILFSEKYGCVADVQRVRLMSQDEYQDYLRENADRMYSGEGYSFEDYRRDAASVAVPSFRMEQFGLNEAHQRYINENFAPSSETRSGVLCMQCRSNSSVGASLIANELGCELVCNQGLTGFYKNDNRRMILYFCDGDVSLLVFTSPKAYAEELDAFNRYFELDGFNVCLEVYFDNVHVDDVFLPRENVGMAISSMLQRGYDGYHAATKTCWESLLNQRKCPNLSFRVVETPTMVRDIDMVLNSALERSNLSGSAKSTFRDYVMG